jgi:hypothetical protein
MAVYYSLRIVVDDNGRAMPISGISGVTLVNSLPLSFIVYDGSNDAQSRKTMLPTLMGMLKDVEEANQAGAGNRVER